MYTGERWCVSICQYYCLTFPTSFQWSEYQQVLRPFAHPLVVINIISLISQSEVSTALLCSSALVISDIFSPKRGWLIFRGHVQSTERGLDGREFKFSCSVPDYFFSNVLFLKKKSTEVCYEIPLWRGPTFIRNIFSCQDYCINHVFFLPSWKDTSILSN